MIPYAGKNSSTQTMRTKSIHFEYKNFALCFAEGYPYLIDPYCHAVYGGKVSKIFVLSVMDCITEVGNWEYKEVFSNNWFSSLSLMTVLKDQGIRATGTVRTDRLGKELKLNKKSTKTEVRGIVKCHYKKNDMGVICWNDNGPVTVILLKRWNSSSRTYIKINRLHCITKYNKYMGEFDSLDALVSVYRIDVRCKK